MWKQHLPVKHQVARSIARFQEVMEEVELHADSTVALQWIKGDGQYKQFVANRVAT